MDYAGLTKLLIRIGGVLSIANAIGTLPLLFAISGIGLATSAIVLPLLIGCLLFLFAGPITNRIFNAPVAAHAQPEVSKVERAALFVLGCYLLAHAVVEAISASTHLALLSWANALRASSGALDYARLCATIAQLGIGFALIFGSRGIVALKNRVLSSPPTNP